MSFDTPVDRSALEQKGIQVKSIAKDDFGLEIPVESVPLPSAGLIYSHPALKNKDFIDIRAMTAREEEILTSRALIKNGTVINELLKSCVVDKSIDTSTLISGDRTALLIALRITGYGSDYPVNVKCEKCGEEYENVFNLSELEINRLEEKPSEEFKNIFDFYLPVTKKTIKVRFLDGNDEIAISKTLEKRKKTGTVIDTSLTEKLLHSIVSVDGIEDKTKLLVFIKNMPARDSLALRTFLETKEPSIKMSLNSTCIHCNEESEVSIPLGVRFFWPNARV